MVHRIDVHNLFLQTIVSMRMIKEIFVPPAPEIRKKISFFVQL